MNADLGGLKRRDIPFAHWIDRSFLSADEVREINATWPAPADERWVNEDAGHAKKSAIMFPRRLHAPAQALAQRLYSAESVAALSSIVGIELVADPWFEYGPLLPRLGGGLHEIRRGGLLKMHVDFSVHPSGLTRALNMLIFLNEGWLDDWGGALELGLSEVKILPRAGTAVVFETNGSTWHGHPSPLKCPEDRSRRSLALYYYRREKLGAQRRNTVYRKT